MKKLRLTVIVILVLACIAALAQTIKMDINSSVGNAEAMMHNMNEPNSVNPAKDNIQNYERDGKIEKCDQPEKNLGNNYNRTFYENTNK